MLYVKSNEIFKKQLVEICATIDNFQLQFLKRKILCTRVYSGLQASQPHRTLSDGVIDAIRASRKNTQYVPWSNSRDADFGSRGAVALDRFNPSCRTAFREASQKQMEASQQNSRIDISNV
jgi:hypothetical protein